MTADSTPAPWGPPEGLGVKAFPNADTVLYVGKVNAKSLHYTPGHVREMWNMDRVDQVPPTPGGES